MAKQITTTGDLRGFLASVMQDVRAGSVDAQAAAAISKLAAQINQSLAVEVNTALQLERMGKDHPVAGTMVIGGNHSESEQPKLAGYADSDGMLWCAQCDARVSEDDAISCKSRHCSLRLKQ